MCHGPPFLFHPSRSTKHPTLAPQSSYLIGCKCVSHLQDAQCFNFWYFSHSSSLPPHPTSSVSSTTHMGLYFHRHSNSRVPCWNLDIHPPTISPIKLFPPTSSLACLTLLHTPLHPIHHNICIRLKREERREEFLLFLFPPIFFQISNVCCSVLCARIKTVTICALIAANLATWIISNSNRVTVLHKEKPLLFLMNTLTLSPALSP